MARTRYSPVAMSGSRSERARRQVLASTADLVTEVGVDRLTIDDAKLARSTIPQCPIVP